MYSLCVNALVRYSIKRRPLYPLVSTRTPVPRKGRTKDVMQVLFHKHVWLYSEYMPTLHRWIGASSVSPYVMTVTWWTASGIILHHRSIAYELSIYCSLLIYFSVAIATITTKYQKHYFYYCYLLLSLPLLSYYFATKHFAADIKFQVWLNWQLSC